MKITAVIVIVLSDLFVAVESVSPPYHPYKESQQCVDALKQCHWNRQRSHLADLEPRHYTVLSNNIARICQDYQLTAECLHSRVQVCSKSIQVQMKIEISLLKFLCSEKGRRLAMEIRDSECYKHSTSFDQFKVHERSCYDASINSAHARKTNYFMCHLVYDVIDCESRYLTGLCGQATGRLFREFSNTKEAFITPPECRNASAKLCKLVSVLSSDIFTLEYQADTKPLSVYCHDNPSSTTAQKCPYIILAICSQFEQLIELKRKN